MFVFFKINDAVAKLLNLKEEHADHQAANGEENVISSDKILKTPRVSFNYEAKMNS
jgi:hypothetical protein